MKNKLWLLQLPFVLLFAAAFVITELGVQGELESGFLRDRLFLNLRSVSNAFTDLKFRLRGPTAPRNKIVIVEIDSESLDLFGRWPWHRDLMAMLIDQVFKAGAKTVGLDVVFSETDERVPPELKQVLAENKLGELAEKFETDPVLQAVIQQYRDRLVLGWTTDTVCQPFYDSHDNGCPVTNPDAIATHPAEMPKFTFTEARLPQNADPTSTPAFSFLTFIPNLPQFNQAGRHAGYFNIQPDSDGCVRRVPLLYLADGKPYPPLSLEMARVALGEDLRVEFDSDFKVKQLGFLKSGIKLPANPMGIADINFRGPGKTFKYVSAVSLLVTGSEPDLPPEQAQERKLANVSALEALKDAQVLIGISALGVHDMRAFPYDSNVPGVEGHATILDNILSNDFLTRGNGAGSWVWVLLLMTVGALGLAYATERLESVPALLLFVVVFSGIGVGDLQLFSRLNTNWDTGFLYIELLFIFGLIVAGKYVLEERSKKFVRGAFAKYVAPAVVDSILKDPAKLSVGGVKKDLTIMFSDIRSFTTFSERMDAKALAAFLNEYLGTMTEIVFAHEGTLDKYIGDAIMAFWGAPLDQKNHAENACRAAIRMMGALHEHKERFRTTYGIDVNIGIGINSGAVSVGNMGSNNNFAYTVIGDHVNLASRLEGLTKAYGVSILTTRYTFEEIDKAGGKQPPHRVLDHVKVKGKKKAVELIQVLDREFAERGLKLFAEGRELYSRQKWDEAAQAFRQANDLLRPAPGLDDGPCAEFVERCKMFKENPPGADWDGSWEMHSK
ncbi:MAG: adenylate/guanylate cyclase domain-containing protein [Oligoflexia bacterium]|nr:adenylate/guanylate cyclase domain-containing protein [Oligoflexia bacterium]